jgi:hypothetical protein
MSITAIATVTLTIEVKAEGCWADNTSIEQVHKQARDSAIGILNRCVRPDDRPLIKIIGTPRIVSVMTDNK